MSLILSALKKNFVSSDTLWDIPRLSSVMALLEVSENSLYYTPTAMFIMGCVFNFYQNLTYRQNFPE